MPKRYSKKERGRQNEMLYGRGAKVIPQQMLPSKGDVDLSCEYYVKLGAGEAEAASPEMKIVQPGVVFSPCLRCPSRLREVPKSQHSLAWLLWPTSWAVAHLARWYAGRSTGSTSQ